MRQYAESCRQNLDKYLITEGLTADFQNDHSVEKYLDELNKNRKKVNNLLEEALDAAENELPKLLLSIPEQLRILSMIRLADVSQLEDFLERYRKTHYKIKVFKTFIYSEL